MAELCIRRVWPLTIGDPTINHKFWDLSAGKEVFSFPSILVLPVRIDI